MIVPEYTPGDWYAVVSGGIVLLLAPSTPPEVVRDVWASAPQRGGGLSGQLDALVRHGIGELHPFAAIDLTGDTVHTALRGAVEVEVVRGARTEVLAAPDVVSWSERSVGAADEVTVRVSGGTRGGALPVVSGVVRASRVRVRLTGSGAAEAGDGAALPVADPVMPDPAAPAPLVPVTSPAPGLPGPASSDDHDGLTILSGELASIRQHLPSWAVSQTGEVASGPLVPSPTPAPDAFAFHGTADQATDVLPAPAPAPGAPTAETPVIALSTGDRVPLDAVVLIGRSPQPSRASEGTAPRLVTVPSPEQDISRTHAEVRQEHGRVLVTDLYSTNGITVANGSLAPRRLTAGEAVAIAPGDRVDLGDGVTFTVEPGA